jgi:hypothetical protein
MERSAIRDAYPNGETPDYAALHPGYGWLASLAMTAKAL